MSINSSTAPITVQLRAACRRSFTSMGFTSMSRRKANRLLTLAAVSLIARGLP